MDDKARMILNAELQEAEAFRSYWNRRAEQVLRQRFVWTQRVAHLLDAQRDIAQEMKARAAKSHWDLLKRLGGLS